MWFDALLIIIVLICVITDLKSRKIYNKVIFPGLLIAFTSHIVLGGWGALTTAFIGFIVGLGLLLIPYLLGGMGAGDVKFLALIGALKGASFVLITALYMSILGGIMALGILLLRKDFLKSVIYFLYGRRYGLKIPVLWNREALQATYPYGVAIAGGAICSLLAKGWITI